jgi:hypothetical protein
MSWLLPYVRVDWLPRMADFAIWATACETALWPTGAFAWAYEANCRTAVEGVIDSGGHLRAGDHG